MEKNKRYISTSFGIFLTTFLIISTVMIFAVLIFLFYENIINEAKNDAFESVSKTCSDVSIDITNLYAENASDEERDAHIRLYIQSELFSDNGEIYIVDNEGTPLFTNMDNYDSFDLDYNDFRIFYSSSASDVVTANSEENSYVVTGYMKIGDTNLNCYVKNEADLISARSDFFSIVLVPSIISLIIAILIFVVLTVLMTRPLTEISRVMNSVGEGDYSVRVDKKFTNYDDQNFTVSDDVQKMARNVNSMIERLENQEADRNIFISSVAHDIRTPLTSINGFVTAMLDGTIPYENQEKYLKLIKQEINRIRSLIVSMTEASSLSKMDPELMESFNFQEVVFDIKDNLEPQLTEKNITLDIELDKNSNHMVYGQSQELCRVVMNIITNAIKFTPNGGNILVSTNADDKNSKLIISVEDSGPGVEKEKRNRVFESFYKADSSRKQEGFGLGLYICKQILQGHGQSIYLDESEKLGGARFVFSFPYPPKEAK